MPRRWNPSKKAAANPWIANAELIREHTELWQAAGQAGRWVLVASGACHGFFASEQAASQAGRRTMREASWTVRQIPLGKETRE